MTLALPKVGLTLKKNRIFVGDLYLADISVPPDICRKITGKMQIKPFFSEAEIIKVEF